MAGYWQWHLPVPGGFFGSAGVGGPGVGGPGGGGTGLLPIPPPQNITVTNAPGGNFLVTFTNQSAITNSYYKSIKYRLYYLNLTEVAATDLGAQFPRVIFAPGKRHWVQDVPVTPGPTVTLTLDATPYLEGGWFYASGVNATGIEGITCGPCPLPIALPYVAPTTEVTNQAVSKTVAMINGLNYATLTFSWKSVNSGVTPAIPTQFVQVYMSNYNNLGQLWEGPTFVNTGLLQTGVTNTGTWLIECDDGTGGFPGPGAHNVTFYFVSLSTSYSHRADPTGAPSATLASGVNS